MAARYGNDVDVGRVQQKAVNCAAEKGFALREIVVVNESCKVDGAARRQGLPATSSRLLGAENRHSLHESPRPLAKYCQFSRCVDRFYLHPTMGIYCLHRRRLQPLLNVVQGFPSDPPAVVHRRKFFCLPLDHRLELPLNVMQRFPGDAPSVMYRLKHRALLGQLGSKREKFASLTDDDFQWPDGSA